MTDAIVHSAWNPDKKILVSCPECCFINSGKDSYSIISYALCAGLSAEEASQLFTALKTNTALKNLDLSGE